MRVTTEGCPGCGRILMIVEDSPFPERPPVYIRTQTDGGVWGWCPTCQTPVENMLKEHAR